MKTEYVWNYNIKVKDKNGEYIYEDIPLEDIVLIDLKHPDREELKAEHIKNKVLKKAFIRTLRDEKDREKD